MDGGPVERRKLPKTA